MDITRGMSGLSWRQRGVVVTLMLAVMLGESWNGAMAEGMSPAKVYLEAAPAVVFIAAVGAESAGTGTGSIVDPKGLILTNAHVILDKKTDAPASKIFVFLKPDRVSGDDNNPANLTRRHVASVIAYHKALDLALLKINNPPVPLPVLPLADPVGTTIGSKVFAIGHPESGGLWTLTTGVISAEWHDFTDVPGKDIFQTETSLNRGNSGGPLIDPDGHQVGVNSMIARKSKDGLAITSINFAIKSNVAREWLTKQGVQLAYAASTPPGREVRSGESPRSSDVPPVANDGSTAPVPQTKTQPTKVLENQSEAKPETGPGLPPARPFSLDRLVKGLDLVQKDLESQMEDMQAEIRKRR